MDKNIIIPCNQRQYDFVFIEWSENLANYILGQDLRGLRESLALKPFNHFVTSKKKGYLFTEGFHLLHFSLEESYIM